MSVSRRLQALRVREGGRILIAIDAEGRFYLRRIACVEERATDKRKSEKIYYCDKHLGLGRTLTEALDAAFKRTVSRGKVPK